MSEVSSKLADLNLRNAISQKDNPLADFEEETHYVSDFPLPAPSENLSDR